MSPTTDPHSNPLLATWGGPYGGVPAFDAMDLDALEPALREAMGRHLVEVQAIADDPSAPTFANTIEALERAGRDLDRAGTYWSIWAYNRSSPEFREIQGRMAPELAAHESRIVQNAALFARVRAVAEGEELATLTPQQRRLVEVVHTRFRKAGAGLEGDAKRRHAEIQSRLAELSTRFANNVLADEEGHVTYLREDQLGGLPHSFVQAAAAAARERGREGEFAVANTRSAMDPFLTFSDERELRETVWRTFYGRADGGEHDNHPVMEEILRLRQERSALLGFANYAEWKLADTMAKTPDRARALLEAVWPAAVARVAEEVAEMQELADRSGAGHRIEPWDYRYWGERVRRERYDLDSGEVKQYLSLQRLREAMFHVAEQAFGLAFRPVPEGSVPVYHPDVRVWEVTRTEDGTHVGLWYLDPYAREGKLSGAWASMYRCRETFDEVCTVLASNNSNFLPAAEGEPVLIGWDDARTLFHEFGHGLHFLSADIAYAGLDEGVRDFIEFQSQLLEHYLTSEPVVERFLVHHATEQPIPDVLVAKLKAAATFQQGFATTEYLACALVDLALHTSDPASIDTHTVEHDVLEPLGMPRELVMRHRTPHFAHVFSGEGYAAGYYGYLWADVLSADAAEALHEAPGGLFDRERVRDVVRHLFAPRNAVDPSEAYRAFRGRDATIDALMRDRGFPVPAGTTP